MELLLNNEATFYLQTLQSRKPANTLN